MANNYCQWSEYISLSSKEESDWLKEVLYFNLNEYDDPSLDWLEQGQVKQKVLREKFGIEIAEGDTDYFPGFSKEFESDNSGVLIYSEEYGNVNSAASILVAFLKKFRPNDYLKIEWAEACSRPRTGEFGGGAVLITANTTDWMSTTSWLEEKSRSFKK